MERRIATVLIGTSLAEASDEIVASGVRLARALGARVHLAHAFAVPVAYTGVPFAFDLPVEQVFEAERAALKARLAAQIERIGIRPDELAGTTLELGPPHRVLNDAARTSGADLVVVGAAEGSARLARIFGSTADRVVRQATRPVLVVRGELAVPFRRVLLPVDLSPLSADSFRRGLSILAQVAGAGAAELEALFVITEYHRLLLGRRFPGEQPEPHAARDLDRFLARHAAGGGFAVAPRLGSGFVDQAVLARVDEQRPDLIVLGTHGAGGFERFLIGSVAASVVRHGHASVLVIPPEAALVESLAHEAAARREQVTV